MFLKISNFNLHFNALKNFITGSEIQVYCLKMLSWNPRCPPVLVVAKTANSLFLKISKSVAFGPRTGSSFDDMNKVGTLRLEILW